MRAPIVYATSSVACASFRARAVETPGVARVSKVRGPHHLLCPLAKSERAPVSGWRVSKASPPASQTLSAGRMA
jgi:hypothetical protein